MKIRLFIITILLIGFTCTFLFGCRTTKKDVVYPYLTFYSMDELINAVNDCQYNPDKYNSALYSTNKFQEFEMKYMPIINIPNYSLLNIQINEYYVFYHYVPTGDDFFSYQTGIVVAFPREEGATIEVIRMRKNATLEVDGSYYDDSTRCYFIPLDEKYYYIRFPNSYEGVLPDKSIVIIEKLAKDSNN